jgi:hypothetical protein
MLAITQDSYSHWPWRMQSHAICLSESLPCLPAEQSGARRRLNAAVMAPAALAVCALALWGSSRIEGNLDLTPRLLPVSTVQNPGPAPDPIESRPVVSLINGTEIKTRLRTEGRGELTIKNGTAFDAIVNLVDPRTRRVVRSFYVQSDKSFVETSIGPGVYAIYFSTGKDWDGKTRSFREDASYGRLEREVAYAEREDPLTGQTEYRGYEVQLQAVAGADIASSLPVDKQTFQEMMDQTSDSAQLDPNATNRNPVRSN